MQLRDKTVLVTGGGGLIGSVACKTVVERGGNVIVVDVDIERASTVVEHMQPHRFLLSGADFSKPEQVDDLIDEARSRFGSIDGVVHCAYPRSLQWGKKFEEIQMKPLAEDLSLQLGGAIIFAQRIIRSIRDLESLSFILISSIQSEGAPKFYHYKNTSMVSPIEYSAIKAGINAVVRYLAKYNVGRNIRVNAISPGGIFDGQPAEFVRRYRQDCINKGLLDAEDIVGAISFLLSDDSKFVNGQNIIVDDGWSL